jgi:hypothetical protein
MNRPLGDVRQLGFVVRDIKTSVEHWIHAMGVGPFFYFDRVESKGFMYKGTLSPVNLSIAVAHAGSIQIEFIQQHNDAPTMYRDFTEAGQEGLHHIAYWTEHFERDLERMLSLGYSIGQSGAPRKDGRFVYFMPDTRAGIVIELSEISGSKGIFFREIADAAEKWNGSEPIRYLTRPAK